MTTAPGFPDLVLKNQARIIAVIELKTDVGRAKPAQIEWLTAFHAAGIPSLVLRPADYQHLVGWLENPTDFPVIYGWKLAEN